MTTLSYACRYGLINASSWRELTRRHGILANLIISLASCPLCVACMLNQTPLALLLGRFSWRTILAISIANQLLGFVIWLTIAFSLLFDERPLTDAEEVMMPLVPVVLASWALMDLLAGALLVL